MTQEEFILVIESDSGHPKADIEVIGEYLSIGWAVNGRNRNCVGIDFQKEEIGGWNLQERILIWKAYKLKLIDVPILGHD